MIDGARMELGGGACQESAGNACGCMSLGPSYWAWLHWQVVVRPVAQGVGACFPWVAWVGWAYVVLWLDLQGHAAYGLKSWALDSFGE